jgi:hypothetical protein
VLAQKQAYPLGYSVHLGRAFLTTNGITDDLHATQTLFNTNTPGLLSHKLYIKVDNKRNWEPWLQVKELSLLGAGKGIFALREFRKGQVIGWYYGKKVADSNHKKKEAIPVR